MADQALAQSKPVSDERVVPGETDELVYREHLARYEFASQFVRDRRVLDVACGSGYGAPVLCGAGARSYLGVDVSPEAVGIALSRYKYSSKASFLTADACRLDGIDDASMDVAVSFETIEHLTDPAQFLASLRRVLVPGGSLIISTPNRTVMNASGNLHSVPLNPFHVREWNLHEFIELLIRFFALDLVLGQMPVSYWRLLGRKASTRRYLGWLQECYGAARARLEGSARAASMSNGRAIVKPMRPWEVQAYIVCVCRRAPAGPQPAHS